MGLRMWTLLLSVVFAFMPVCVCAESVDLQKDDLFFGIGFFGNLEEIEASEINFIPREYFDLYGGLNTIQGTCVLMDHLANVEVSLPVHDGGESSVFVSLTVDMSKAQDMLEAIVSELDTRWEGATVERFAILDGKETIPYTGDDSIKAMSALGNDEWTWVFYDWNEAERQCELAINCLTESVRFMLEFRIQQAILKEQEIHAAESVYFRNTRWGMKTEDVESLEGAKLVVTGVKNYQHIEDTILFMGLEAQRHYAFDDDGLYWAGYDFVQEHSDADAYIEDYLKIKEYCIRAYGEPEAEIVVQNGWAQDSEEMITGLEIAFGYAEMTCRFTEGETNIVLNLCGGTGDIQMTLNYHDRNNYPRVAGISIPQNPGC